MGEPETKLIFGAKSSQDLFDEAIYWKFGDMQHNNILLGGRDIEEHNKTMETEEIEHQFTKNGLKPNADEIRAVKEASLLESKMQCEAS